MAVRLLCLTLLASSAPAVLTVAVAAIHATPTQVAAAAGVATNLLHYSDLVRDSSASASAVSTIGPHEPGAVTSGLRGRILTEKPQLELRGTSESSATTPSARASHRRSDPKATKRRDNPKTNKDVEHVDTTPEKGRTRIQDGNIHDKRNKPAQYPLPVESVGSVVVNNLGGLGPEKGKDPIMRFEDLTIIDTVSVYMVVANTTPYYTTGPSKNGARNGIGFFNVMAGQTVGMNFSFYSIATGAPVMLDEFQLTLLDLDMSPTLRETVTASNFEEYYITSNSNVTASKVNDVSTKFSATALDGKSNNPSDAALLNQEQLDNAIGLAYKKVHNVAVTFGVEVTSEGENVSTNLIQINKSPGRKGQSARMLMFTTSTAIFRVGKSHSASSVAKAGSAPQKPQMGFKEASSLQNDFDRVENEAYFDGNGVEDVPAEKMSPSNLKPGTTVAGPKNIDDALQCASEWDNQWGDCPECTWSRDCSCAGGLVRFGYEPRWTDWYRIKGSVECSAAYFGDPYPGHGKLCMCLLPNSGKNGAPVSSAKAENSCAARHGAYWWPPLFVAFVFFGTYLASCYANAINRAYAVRHRQMYVMGPIEKALEATLPVVRVAPMICVVFVAVAFRVAVLPGQGEPVALLTSTDEANVASQLSRIHFRGYHVIQAVISVCAVILLGQVILRYFTEREQNEFLAEQDKRPYYMDGAAGRAVKNIPLVSVAFCVLTGTLYLFTIVLTASIFFIGAGKAPPIDVSISCTAVLATAYFLAYFLAFLIMFGPCSHITFTLAVVKLAALNLHFVPMICALFLTLQVAVDSFGTKMTKHMEELIYWSTIAALVQTFLAIISTCMFNAKLQQPTAQQQASEWARLSNAAGGGTQEQQLRERQIRDQQLQIERRDAEGDEAVIGHVTDDWLVMKRGCGVFCMTAIRWIIMGILLVMMAKIARELWHVHTCPEGIGDLVAILTFVYFLVYVLLWLALTCGRKTETGEASNPRALRFWNSAKNGVDLVCPLLAVLRVSWWIYGNLAIYNGN